MISKISISIVEDHPALRFGLCRLIETQEDMQVAGEASNAIQAIELILDKNPDIALIDIELDGNQNGLELLKSIKDYGLQTRSIIFSIYKDPVYIQTAIKYGARGFLSKSEPFLNILKAIREIASGGCYIKACTETDSVTGNIYRLSPKIENLSPRETEIFRLTGLGFSITEISEKLGLKINTVKTHRKNIIDKLNLEGSHQLLKSAIQWIIAKR